MFTYGLVGLAIEQLQAIETFLTFCMCVVFEDEGGKPLEDLTDPRTQKKTLGQFLKRLRSKSTIDPRFDTILEHFLEHRNTLVHNLTKDEQYSFHTKEGRQSICYFLNVLHGLSDTVSKTLLGFMMHWADPDKYSDLPKVRIQFKEGAILGDAEQIFAPHSSKIIRKKP